MKRETGPADNLPPSRDVVTSREEVVVTSRVAVARLCTALWGWGKPGGAAEEEEEEEGGGSGLFSATTSSPSGRELFKILQDE